MDETVKIYTPIKHFDNLDGFGMEKKEEKSEPKPKLDLHKSNGKHSDPNNSKWKFIWFDKETLKQTINEKAAEVHELEKKYPWYDILYNWVCALLVVVLFVSFGIWGVDIHTKRTAQAYADSVAAQKDAEHQAFIAQQEADKLAAEQSLENIMKANAQVKAKLAYGSRNFIEKYNYSDADFMTLYQCIDNRLKNSMYTGMTIDEIAFQEGQFIASFDTNPVQDYYFNLAMKSERLKQAQVSEPVGTDYVYTIYTPHGIFLANDPKAPAYTWWRYSE